MDDVYGGIERDEPTTAGNEKPQDALERLGGYVPVVVWIEDDEHRILAIDKPRISIGRVEFCDVMLPMPNVSRIHAFIRYVNCGRVSEEPQCVLADNHSTNGLYLNGEAVLKDEPLKNGDVISISDYTLGFFIRKEREWKLSQQKKTIVSSGGGVRVPVNFSVRLRVLNDNSGTISLISGACHDLSLTGLRFSTPELSEKQYRELLIGAQMVRCEITIPGQEEPLRLLARMAWTHFDNRSSPQTCFLGLEFKNPDQQSQRILARQIEELQGD